MTQKQKAHLKAIRNRMKKNNVSLREVADSLRKSTPWVFYTLQGKYNTSELTVMIIEETVTALIHEKERYLRGLEAIRALTP